MESHRYISSRGGIHRSYASSGSWRRNQNIVEYATASKFGPIANMVTIILLVALLGMVYVTQVSKTGSYGYELNNINERKSELAAKQDDLKIENARLQALVNIKDSQVAKAMVAPASTDYAE